jgi:hypothetical protein
MARRAVALGLLKGNRLDGRGDLDRTNRPTGGVRHSVRHTLPERTALRRSDLRGVRLAVADVADSHHRGDGRHSR